VQSVVADRRRSLNEATGAISACSDKWEAFERLTASDLQTVPTCRFDPAATALSFEYPLVLKPRFGAGSQDTFLIHNADQLHSAASWFTARTPTTEAIVQPWIAGRSLSVAAVFRSDGTLRELWPVGEQHLSDDGRFQYHGGHIPCPVHCDHVELLSALGARIAAAIPGLAGYIGIDFILPDGRDGVPLIVDINPRLTTSYLGYRALTTSNLAGRILWPDREWPPIVWRDEAVRFQADGRVVHSSASRG
jgi:predicted ATP-grasp superfamily ATP-dependent carboligase